MIESGDFEKQLDDAIHAPVSEDLPENIETIEKAIGEAYMGGLIGRDDAPSVFIERFKSILLDRRVSVQGDLTNVALKVRQRMLFGLMSWDFGLGDKRREAMAIYETLKDRPSVKRVVELGGICQDSLVVIRHIKAIDDELAKGKSYQDVYGSIIYRDDASSCHAFLNHVEERVGAEIKSKDELLKLAHVREQTYEAYMESIKDEDPEEGLGMSPGDYQKILASEDCYRMAIESRYAIALDKKLRDGGKYKDLLAIDPKTFGLSEKWNYPYNLGAINAREKKWAVKEGSKQDMILKAIFFQFRLGEAPYMRPPLRDVADAIDAPYGEILKASKYYD